MATLNYVGMIVQDMAATLAFYRLLGLEIPAETDGDEHVEVTLAGGFRLAWDTVEITHSFNPDWTPAKGYRMGLAFQCADPAEVDRLYAEVVAAGYHGQNPPWDAFWGHRYAIVHDPEGNPVDLYAPLA
jgi:catechol 2,3-dioxygenase-like lactoylglutathione lyase family enzyme